MAEGERLTLLAIEATRQLRTRTRTIETPLETTAVASSSYRKLPDVRGKTVMLVDPMLATGGSACHALSALLPGRKSPQRRPLRPS